MERIKRDRAELEFEMPVGKGIGVTTKGEYGADRSYGPHKGVDFGTKLLPVYAVEDGRVVYSGERRGTAEKGNYGNTVVIDHTPMGRAEERHIYSLYAHLDERFVNVGTDEKIANVIKGQKIGKSGNTGTKAHYKGWNSGFHLHFEIIDAPRGFDFSNGWPGDLENHHRKNPTDDYLGQEKIIEYFFTKEEMNKIVAHLDGDPFIDFKRKTWYTDIYLGRKKLGRIDKHNSKLKVNLASEEVDELLRKPAPSKKPKKLSFKLNLA